MRRKKLADEGAADSAAATAAPASTRGVVGHNDSRTDHPGLVESQVICLSSDSEGDADASKVASNTGTDDGNEADSGFEVPFLDYSECTRFFKL